MEQLYNFVLPAGSTFDVDGLSKQLSCDPTVIQHPHMSNPTFIFCANSESVDRLWAKLTADTKYPVDTYGVVTLRPRYITVNNTGSEDDMHKIAQFVLPLVKDLNCKIVNEFAIDITVRYQGQFERLFYDKPSSKL